MVPKVNLNRGFSMKNDNKPLCINCHFLVDIYQTFDPDIGGHIGYSFIPDEDREKWKQEKQIPKKDFPLKCHFDVWDYLRSSNMDSKEILKKDRKGFCFFWPYHKGMTFEAGAILQKRAAENEAANRDRKLTIWGLWIAALSLVISVCFKIWKEIVK